MDFISINRAALDKFVLTRKPTSEMVVFLAEQAEKVITCDPNLTTTVAATPNTSVPPLPTLKAFIASVVLRSGVPVATLMASAVYLARLRARLPSDAKGMRCTAHRVFLACLIVASKNLNDACPLNYHWSRFSRVKSFNHFGFSVKDVTLMERQLLFILDWDVRVKEEDLFEVLEPFLAPIREEIQIDRAHIEWRHLRASGELFAKGTRRQKQVTRDEISSSLVMKRLAHSDAVSINSSNSNGNSDYNSPQSSIDDNDRYNIHFHTSSYRLNRSNSPPSVTDLPGLSYAPSISLGSRSSSLSPSSRGTPASIRTLSSNSESEVLVADDSRSPAVFPQRSLREFQQQPRKKLKISGYGYGEGNGNGSGGGGGFVARFLASAAGSMGGRIGRGRV